LTDGHVDWDQSPYYNNASLPGVKPAYAGLATEVGTDQIIWCYPCRELHTYMPSENRVEWRILTTIEQVLVVVNDWPWNLLVETKGLCPATVRSHPGLLASVSDLCDAHASARPRERSFSVVLRHPLDPTCVCDCLPVPTPYSLRPPNVGAPIWFSDASLPAEAKTRRHQAWVKRSGRRYG
jgi:hypothetical protein